MKQKQIPTKQKHPESNNCLDTVVQHKCMCNVSFSTGRRRQLAHPHHQDRQIKWKNPAQHLPSKVKRQII
eukprot:6267540-Ditylum_brightwellii.AAC.1